MFGETKLPLNPRNGSHLGFLSFPEAPKAASSPGWQGDEAAEFAADAAVLGAQSIVELG
jgi:hypothetical protein